MSPDLKELARRDINDALLLAEIGAWLHMFSKFHEDFLTGTKDFDINIPTDLKKDYPLLDSLLTLTWTGQIWDRIGISDLNAIQLSIENLIHEHRNQSASNGLEKLMWDAHGRGSGIEKGLLYRFAENQKKIVYLSTAFGFEKDPIDPQDISNKRKILYNNLHLQLNELKQTKAHPLDGWRIFRQSFISMLSQLFSLTVADTRRPLNDVSLFDQTVASVAFFKASLAQILLLQKWKEPNTKSIADKYQWRILRIGFDGVTFWSKSSKISDIDARKQLISPVLDEIRHLLETDYPMGYEIYRDEMGSVFIIPDVDDLLNGTLDDGKNLSERISDLSKKHFDLEANLQIFPITSRTRNMQPFGSCINEPLPESFIDSKWLNDIQNLWSQRNEVCIVCGLRPQGPGKKSLSRNVCDICEKRRLDRAKKWSEKLNHTIWIDEVADLNGRIALIVGAFDLKDWLNGKLVSSILSFNPSNRLLNDPERKINYQFDYSNLLKDIQQGLNNPRQTLGKKTPLVNNLILKDQRIGAVSDQFGEIYDLYVSDSDLNDTQKEDWRFALAMIRQQPSPARIHRIWKTTQKFWQEVTSGFIKTVGQVETRLEFKGELHPNKTEETLGSYHVYELRLENTKLSVVWDAVNNRFITAENMEYLAQPEQLGRSVKNWLEMHSGQKIIVEESTGYGDKNKKWGAITVDEVHEISDSRYTPVIPILAEPRTFMALVPANKALSVIKAINNKYEEEMNKVRNRLPLTIGLVFAKSHTPVSSIMDAGRRMLNITENDATWTIKSKNPDNTDPSKIELTLNKNEQCIQVKVDTLMGDKTPDEWYPYWLVESDAGGKTPSNRTRQFIWHDKNIYVHVCDLQIGDKVKFTPSRFDFEFLDSAARRFEVSYNDGKRRDNRKNKRKINRPYYLEELSDFENIWCILKKNLKRTQIKKMLGLIETKREEWQEKTDDKTFEAFVHDVVHNANWINGKPEKINDIEKAAVSGKLNDIVELYMDILKDKEEDNEEEKST